MSEYSEHINRFLEAALLPEIDMLNMKLSSYTDFSYNGKSSKKLMLRLSQLVTIYDFLLEYVNGDEECELSSLRELISLTGLAIGNNQYIMRAFDPWAPMPGGESPAGTRILIQVAYTVNGTDENPTVVDGNYLLTTGISASWVPSGAEVDDILRYENGIWSILYAVRSMAAGSLEIEYVETNGMPTDKVSANYVWDGDRWDNYDAYEPNDGLENISVSNPNLGDISEPPYGIPAYTGGALRGRSISAILDGMIFETIPYNYVAPTTSLVAKSGNLERGSDLAGNIVGTYTKRDGGDLNNQDPTFIVPGGDEIEITVTMGIDEHKVADNSHTPGNRSITLDVPVDADVRIPSEAATSAVGDIEFIARTADGVEQLDNKGNPTPRPSDVMARILVRRAYYYSRYPIWIGSTTEKFTVSNPELTDLSINPNSGSNTNGTLLDSSWLQSSGLGMKSLFTVNLTNHTINVKAGDAHLLVICPPGITVSGMEMLVFGSWEPITNLASFQLTDILSANNDEPRTYTAYYLRDVSDGIYTTDVQYRISTVGTIQP